MRERLFQLNGAEGQRSRLRRFVSDATRWWRSDPSSSLSTETGGSQQLRHPLRAQQRELRGPR